MNETARLTVYRTLEELGISYTIAEHAPMHTVEDMMNATLGTQGTIAKNLFLRDAKGRRHFLIVVRWDKNVDIKTLRTVIGSTALSFGSEERLMTHLGIRPGSVSPFCILNNTEKMSKSSLTATWPPARSSASTPTTTPPPSSSPSPTSNAPSATTATRPPSSASRKPEALHPARLHFFLAIRSFFLYAPRAV